MPKADLRKIVLIGAGKLATNFAFSAKEKNLSILQICNRSVANGKNLSEEVSAQYIQNLDDIRDDADIYAVAVSDSAIPDIAQKIRLNEQLLIHFSGTSDISILHGSSRNYGILYPPQTFTKENNPGFIGIPLCIEGNNPASEGKLKELAAVFSDKIYRVNSCQRKIIHLSAIFAGNFTNFMYSIAENILRENNLPMDLLESIIHKTASNAGQKNIFRLQTGPAIREDYHILSAHLEILSSMPEYKEIYRIISESIIKHKHQHDKL